VGSAVKSKWMPKCRKKSPVYITLEKKMEEIRSMEDGQTRPDVCRSTELRSSTVSTITKIVCEIEQAVQHGGTVHAAQVSYSRTKLLPKVEKLLSNGWMT
jgi:hypothetical protein